jgi:threonine synthase
VEYTDTRDKNIRVSFKTAVMDGMSASSGGLYVPVDYPRLPEGLLNRRPEASFRDIALETAKCYATPDISEADLEAIIVDAYPFSAPVMPLDRTSYVLELFHGPTCAFKDFGARFMARAMSYFNRGEDSPLHILVATSGDTGSAVGSAFHRVPGLDVTILYPAGKVSPLQEKQLCTFDGNVRAFKVAGTFDDCQKLVKTAFTDPDLRKVLRLTSANSINIARLLPQSFYYTYAALVVKNRTPRDSKIDNPAIIFAVPSGNFGNLTSGLIARKMGAPIRGFIAATNANKTVPDWIASGTYTPRPSVQTLSNAMDVGAPSNYERIVSMYTLEEIRSLFAAFSLDDEGTIQAIEACHHRTGYIMDPHGAVAWKAWDSVRNNTFPVNTPEWAPDVKAGRAVCVLLETAHCAKFGETVKHAIGRWPTLPDRLDRIKNLPSHAIPLENDYNRFKELLLAK